MNEFSIKANNYLKKNTLAFYHVPYVGMGNPGNPDYLNTLKNTFNSSCFKELDGAIQELRNVLSSDFSQIIQSLGLPTVTVCVVPRAKAESSYRPNQLLFRSTVRWVVGQFDRFEDGTGYLRRHTTTKTTHLRKPIENYNNDGPMPYPGITAETCDISTNANGKHILLVDDIYTPTVNIDEDAIQALIGAGARSVAFYAVAYTVRRNDR